MTHCNDRGQMCGDEQYCSCCCDACVAAPRYLQPTFRIEGRQLTGSQAIAKLARIQYLYDRWAKESEPDHVSALLGVGAILKDPT